MKYTLEELIEREKEREEQEYLDQLELECWFEGMFEPDSAGDR